MYTAEVMTREEFRKSQREKVMLEQKSRRRKVMLFFLTLVLVFGMGVMFGTLLAAAEEHTEEPVYKYYANVTIQSGDTLWNLASEYMDSDHYRNKAEYINEVMNINHMVSDRLTTGQKIIVPYYSSEIK